MQPPPSCRRQDAPSRAVSRAGGRPRRTPREWIAVLLTSALVPTVLLTGAHVPEAGPARPAATGSGPQARTARAQARVMAEPVVLSGRVGAPSGRGGRVVARAGTVRARRVRAGSPAVGVDPATGTRTRLTVTAVRAEGGSGVEVLLSSSRPLPAARAGAVLHVEVSTAGSAPPVLAVPAPAVHGRGAGGLAVTVLQPDGSAEEVGVLTGRTVSGWVEVACDPAEPLASGSAVLLPADAR